VAGWLVASRWRLVVRKVKDNGNGEQR